jgi:hypothetical protein
MNLQQKGRSGAKNFAILAEQTPLIACGERG